MPKETIQYPGLGAYQEQVNIGLFNDIIAFVMATTAAETTPVNRKLTEKHLWYSESGSENIQDRYGFRYFGELLERYEDKAGSDIKDIRAIALAMAYTKGLITDDMIVGHQKTNFIRKITNISEENNDLYLKAALYLLRKDETDASGLLDELTQTIYTRTEELIFVVSIYDDFEQAFLTFKPQLINLLGKDRTMPASGNMKIYWWLVKRFCLCSKIKESRTKDMALFRAFMELPVAFVKTGSRHHDVLLDNGYTAEDIIYLNSYIIRNRPFSGTIDVNSIVAEKIAVEMCRTFINSENTHHAEVYEHLEWLLEKYEKFVIKITGYEGIYKAVEKEIKIINPQTFIWLYKLVYPKDNYSYNNYRLDNNVFRFDIMDEKWDILSREFASGVYLNLFNKQLIRNDEYTKEHLTEIIEKYDTLTGLSYLEQFETEFSYGRDSIFALMVEKSIINIVDIFKSRPEMANVTDEDKDNDRPAMLHYIRNYIKGINSRESFDFFRYFFGEYNFNDMHRILLAGPDYHGYRNKDSFFLDVLYKGPARSYGDTNLRFTIKRPFLSDDEHRELFGWLDDYMLQYKADNYIEYAVTMLTDPFMETLFPKEEFKKIYDMVCNMNIDVLTKNIKELNQKFLSEDELQAENDAEELKKQEQKKQDHEQTIQNLKDEFAAKYDGTFESINKYLKVHDYSWKNEDDAMVIVAGYLDTVFEEKDYILKKDEISWFLIISGKLMQKGYLNFLDFTNHILSIREDNDYVENNGTPEPDPDSE